MPALILILLGCFTKSAQFPFHFWLPHAMAAPTPVSAYLHSATMVKAGIFLMARMWPVLSGTPEWFLLVTGAGLITMVLGAVIALFKHDLKALLAFSTVSHLGLITMLLGTGTGFGAMAAAFHILNHATFKAALFMSAGIIDHEAHTRDIRRLGGLRRLMPVTFVIATLAALSMAGIPLLNGFLSKEMMLEEANHTVLFNTPWLVPALAVLGSAFSAAYCFRLIGHVFFGPVRDDYPHKPHDPPAGLWLPPALLVVLVVIIGVAPFLAAPIVEVVTSAIIGGAVEMPKVYIKIWHGLVPALYMSIVATVGGLILLAMFRPLLKGWEAAPRPEAKVIFEAIVEAAASAARGITYGLHNGAFSRYGAIMAATTIIAGYYAFATGTVGPATRGLQPAGEVAIAGWLMLVAATVGMVFLHRNRLLSLILIGIVGLIVSIGFVFFSAPDLAMTQITVEVVTIILMLLALNFLPNQTPIESTVLRRLRDGVIAVAGGLATMGLAYHYLLREAVATPISEFHLANSYKGGGGTNVVNVILVDFRGFDTYGEIIVLGIAALLIYALTETLLGGPVRARLLNRKPDQPRAGDMHPMIDGRADPRDDAGGADGRLLHLPARSQRAGRRLHRRSRRLNRRCHAIHGQRLLLGFGAAALSLSWHHRCGCSGRGSHRHRIVVRGQTLPDLGLHLCTYPALPGIRTGHGRPLRSGCLPRRCGGRDAVAWRVSRDWRGVPMCPRAITRWTSIRPATTRQSERSRDMELLVASGIGILTAAGIYLMLRLRTFPVILGISLLTYAVNVFLFASGRLTIGAPPILTEGVQTYTDPLPQALVLTAIVISFGMTAVVVMIALGAYLGSDDDHVDDQPQDAGKGGAA